MPTRRQHINNIAAQLELQKAEAYKLIDDIALLEERSTSISISVEALKDAEDEAHTSWNQTMSPSPPYSPSSPAYSPTSFAYSPTSPPYSPLPTPPEGSRHHAFRSRFESDDESQGTRKRPKLATSNTKTLLLIACKQRKLKDWKYSPEDHRDLPIWPTYLEGVEEWREFYNKDFPKHYSANAAVYKCKLKKYKVSFSQFE